MASRSASNSECTDARKVFIGGLSWHTTDGLQSLRWLVFKLFGLGDSVAPLRFFFIFGARSLMVSFLSFWVRPAGFLEFFKNRYGAIESGCLMRDRKTGNSRGFLMIFVHARAQLFLFVSRQVSVLLCFRMKQARLPVSRKASVSSWMEECLRRSVLFRSQ